MNGFDQARTVEARALVRLLPFIEERAARFVVTDKGRCAPLLQEIVGDVLFNARSDGARLYSIELKAEQRHTGNLFLETWSNRNLEDADSHAMRGCNPGWLIKSRADLLFYYFLDVDRLYVMDFFALKQWALQGGALTPYTEVRQGKYVQDNDTWGRLVPVADLRKRIRGGVRDFSVAQLDMLTRTAA